MNAPRRHIPRNLLLGALLAGGSMACGQRGPLVLPEEARPIERVELPQPPAQPQPQPQPPEKRDDEQKTNER
jgi:predicted small lipoprotein YifL